MADLNIDIVREYAKHEDYVLEVKIRGIRDSINKNEQIFLYDRVYKKKEPLAQISEEFREIQYRREKLYKDEEIGAIAKLIFSQKKKIGELSTREISHFADVFRGPFERYPEIKSTGDPTNLVHISPNTSDIIISMKLNGTTRRVYKEEQKVIYTARVLLGLHESHVVHALIAWRNKFATDSNIRDLGSKVIFGEKEINQILNIITTQSETPTAPLNNAHWTDVTERDEPFVKKVRGCNVMGRHIPAWEKIEKKDGSQNSGLESSKAGESSKNPAPQN